MDVDGLLVTVIIILDRAPGLIAGVVDASWRFARLSRD